MKKLLLILAIASIGCTASKPTGKPISLRVTYVLKNGYESGISEVWARSRHYWYMAQCENLPDSVKRGTIITALPTKQPDSCKCVFKRMK